MIVRDHWRLSHRDAPPMAASYGTRASVEEWRLRGGLDPNGYEIEAVPYCQCCGALFSHGGIFFTWGNGQARCARHRDRNPCAIEGCGRTTSAPEGRIADDGWLCAEHWRRYCPPRSARRRAYHAFFRKAKRHGWSPELRRQFRRFWDQLVATARAKAAGGSINKSEIARLFGWDDL